MKMQRKKEAKKEKFGMGFAPLYLSITNVWASPMGYLMVGFRRHGYQSMLS